MFIKINLRDGESADKFIRRFGGYIKTTGLVKKFRKGRYFAQKPTQKKVREAALSRETNRAAAKRRKFMSS